MASNLKSDKYSNSHREDWMQFRLIFFAAFFVFLWAAIIDIFLPRNWRLLPQSPEARWSFLGQAKAAAQIAATSAFNCY
jgi:hypothetical protein